MEQMLMSVISDGRDKPELFKHYHVDYFVEHARELMLLLEELFAKDWLEKTPPNQDPFRRLYVHGWPFALKAIASAYHRSRKDELGPLAASINARDVGKTIEEAFADELQERKAGWTEAPTVNFDELRSRLKQIDWLRYRAHWVTLTGAKMKDGKPRLFKLKSTGEEKVAGQAQNTKTVIDAVRNKILSDSWADLTLDVDAK